MFSDRGHCGLNSHYNPFYFNCDYCQVRYNFIGKLENWEEDITNIAQASHKATSWIINGFLYSTESSR